VTALLVEHVGAIFSGMPAAVPPSGGPTSPPEPSGEPVTLDGLFPVVYEELRRVAHRQLTSEVTGHTLNTTALVHEMYLRLHSRDGVAFTDRAHFFAVAARAMRHVLVDCARRFRSVRRGGGVVPLTLEARDLPLVRAEELLDLDEALSRLKLLHPRQASVVEVRFFAGLSEAEAAESLGVTERTVRRDWLAARRWLYDHLRSRR
jgi:RNA polymerase sigma factor (TIGR02999 family)